MGCTPPSLEDSLGGATGSISGAKEQPGGDLREFDMGCTPPSLEDSLGGATKSISAVQVAD